MNRFLTSNDTSMRLARTIVQGILATIASYLDKILGMFIIPDELRPVVFGIVMSVLSPVMSEIGKSLPEEGAEG